MTEKVLVPFSDLLARIQREPLRPGALIGLLPVLEHDYHEALAFESAEALRLPELMAFVLKDGSSYWVALALKWLEAGFPISDVLRNELLLVSERIGFEQSIRHRAYALHRKKKPNKAPEPTPGSVTPRATEGDSK